MNRQADDRAVSDCGRGLPVLAGSIDGPVENVLPPGAPSRYLDPQTQTLGYLAATWMDFQQLRKSMAQRELGDALIESAHKIEEQVGRELGKALRRHPLWPWLSQFPGLGGVHTARLIARIGDPRRFPGQQCGEGHTLVPGYAIGTPCPLDDREGNGCPGDMLAPRTSTGTRSVWHYCGLHVTDDGRSPRKRKGIRCTWDPIARTAVLQPDGIADQIVRQRVPAYRAVYDAKKADLITRRGGAEINVESERPAGPADRPVAVDLSVGGATTDALDALLGFADALDVITEGAELSREIEQDAGPLRPFQIDAIARKVAAKAFVGDLLREWKRIAGAEVAIEIERTAGLGDVWLQAVPA